MRRYLAMAAFVSYCLASAQSLAQNAYITNSGDRTVSVIDTATNTVIATIPVGRDVFPPAQPWGVAVTPDGREVYVTDFHSVSVIDTATNAVTARIFPVSTGPGPSGVAVTPDSRKVYVTSDNIVSVIDTATNNVTGTI